MAFRRYISRFRSCLKQSQSDDGYSELDAERGEEFFLRNGAQLLQEMITFADGRCKPIRMLTEKQVEEATNNFAKKCEILCSSFPGNIYMGNLSGRDITVATTNSINPWMDPSFAINEVAILTRINHPNVVKIVGCCLETDIPLVIYEELPSETLSWRLHEVGPSGYIQWKDRLKIVTEVAHALAYLHTGTTTPIIHRDMQPTNILLGECFSVKIIGFDMSLSLPFGQTKTECELVGSAAYLDPVYRNAGELSEKSDVFSYGIVLLEVLSGRKRFDVGSDLVERLLESAEEEHLISFLDSRVLEEAKKEQHIACMRLALSCIAETWEERPEMKQVVEELWRIRGL